jgi:hypothetical protein
MAAPIVHQRSRRQNGPARRMSGAAVTNVDHRCEQAMNFDQVTCWLILSPAYISFRHADGSEAE